MNGVLAGRNGAVVGLAEVSRTMVESIDIRLEGLCKAFGAVVAVDDVSLHVAVGELFFVLGPSGCGKTTLLRCVAGLCRPDAGRILFGERDITNVSAHRRNAAMMFQNYALWPHMTVEQNVGFGLEVRRVDRRRRRALVEEALELVQMQGLGRRKPNQLSGGQQQRVALARALVVRPGCLLLDEPLSNLDAKLRLEMRGEIRRICKQANLTAIYVTHDQSEALSIADCIAILREGKLEQVGPPRQLYERPANRFVAGFLGETNFLEGTVVGEEGGAVWVQTSLGRVRGSSEDRSIRAGERVACSIRPESIRLGGRAGEEANRFRGRLVQTTYLGQMARHELSVGGVGLTVFELNPPKRAEREGEDVWAWVDPAEVVILR